jgi:hypothetical protein
MLALPTAGIKVRPALKSEIARTAAANPGAVRRNVRKITRTFMERLLVRASLAKMSVLAVPA